MSVPPRRVVTGHDESGKSVVLSDSSPVQHHAMRGPAVGADFHEIWNFSQAVPTSPPGWPSFISMHDSTRSFWRSYPKPLELMR